MILDTRIEGAMINDNKSSTSNKEKKRAFRKILTTTHGNFFIDHKMCEFLEENRSS